MFVKHAWQDLADAETLRAAKLLQEKCCGLHISAAYLGGFLLGA